MGMPKKNYFGNNYSVVRLKLFFLLFLDIPICLFYKLATTALANASIFWSETSLGSLLF